MSRIKTRARFEFGTLPPQPSAMILPTTLLIILLAAFSRADNEHDGKDPAVIDNPGMGWLLAGGNREEDNDRALNTCGCASSNRIVGGGEVSPKYSLPYQVFVFAGRFMCGGTIVNHRYVLTAGHCLYDNNGRKIPVSWVKVVVGEHNMCDGVNEGGQLIHVEHFIERSDYNKYTYANDIAILKLKTDIKFGAHVKPACLPTNPSQSYAGKRAIASGWGQTLGWKYPFQQHGPSSCRLKRTWLTILNNRDPQCMKWTREMCAFKKGTDTCQGDSGGPLAVVEDGKYVVVGVISRGKGCADKFPGIYSRVTSYLGWIEANTKDGNCA